MPKRKGDEVKKVEYVTFALTHAIITAVLSIVFAVVYYVYLVSVLQPIYPVGTNLSVTALAILIPLSAVLGFIGGFLIGLIWALLYNFVVSRFLKFKVET